MPWSDDHKLKSRENILDSAADLFTAKGFDGVSIDGIMTEAGLTRGAFYAHFASKSDVYNKSVLHAAQKAKHTIEEAHPISALELARIYLRIGTPGAKQKYCPLAFLINDVTQRNDEIKNTYTEVLKGFQGIYISMGLPKEQAIQVSVMLIGGLAIAKAITDETLKADILENCLKATETLISNIGDNNDGSRGG